MKMKILVTVIILFASLPLLSFAQGMNIDGDTIYVSTENYSTLAFPDSITDYNPITRRVQDYNMIKETSRTLSITANIKNPVSPCDFLIYEGAHRHRFILVYSEKKKPSHYDLSTAELLEDHIAVTHGKKRKEPVVKRKTEIKENVEAPAIKTEVNPNLVKEAIKVDDESFMIGDQKVPKAEFYARVNKRLQDFTDWTRIIGKKDPKTHGVNPLYRDYINRTMKLFNNDTSKVIQVSSKTSKDPQPRHVRDYLDRIATATKYTEIQITKSDVAFFSKLTLGSDGKYYGHVSYVQDFTGWLDENKVYTDRVKKDQEIIVELTDILSENGDVRKQYQVFLGNLLVAQK